MEAYAFLPKNIRDEFLEIFVGIKDLKFGRIFFSDSLSFSSVSPSISEFIKVILFLRKSEEIKLRLGDMTPKRI